MRKEKIVEMSDARRIERIRQRKQKDWEFYRIMNLIQHFLALGVLSLCITSILVPTNNLRLVYLLLFFAIGVEQVVRLLYATGLLLKKIR